MNVTARHVGIVGLVLLSLGAGCRRLVSAAIGGGETTAACDLLTDGEVASSVGSSSVTHDGKEGSCTWTASDVSSTVNLSVLSPTTAKLIPTMGTAQPVAGIGDSATFYSGLASQMRVTKGSTVLVFVAVVPAAIAAGTTIEEGKTTKKHGKKGEPEVEVTEETIDNPVMRGIYEKLARAAAARM